jgi:hypothetical protein
MNYEDNKKIYDDKCDIHFITKYNESYNVYFFHDGVNNQKFLILENSNKKYMWCNYKILCSYYKNKNILKLAKEMIIVESSIIDNNITLDKNKIKSDKDIDNQIITKLFDYDYIGFIKKTKENITYYYLINKIIRI